MEITKQWIFDNRTDKGGWTRAQLAAIGVSWPARSGWIDKLVGQSISDEAARKFERVPLRRSTTATLSPAVIEQDSAPPSTAVSTVKLWFGMHKGKLLSDVPRPYIDWCLENRVGGGELVEAIAAMLAIEVPRQKRPYDGKTISREQLLSLSNKPGFTVVNRFCDGIDVMGVSNCEDRFDPYCEWPEAVEWDGITAPWLEQSGVLDEEFRSILA